ncbi:MAG: hypothetical protein ACRDRR_15245 [Pseudonocardiaceae bacterium]
MGRLFARRPPRIQWPLQLEPSHRPLRPPPPDGCQRPALAAPPVSAAGQLQHAVASGPTSAPATTEGIGAHEARLAQAARESWSALPFPDTAAAVEAGMLADAADRAVSVTAAATAVVDDEQPSSAADQAAEEQPGRGIAVAAEVGQAAATVQRRGLPATVATPVDWAGFGQVIPVLAGSPGAGASILTAVLSDALQLAGRCALIVDTADPVRSGLAMAARSEGPWVAGPHPSVRIRYSWRAQALLARVETSLPVIAPGMVPPPGFWRPPVRELHATVVDIGHDAWRVTAHPLTGAGEWLRQGSPAPRPVLVVRATRPSLIHAEQVLARLEAWVGIGAATPPSQLVVMGATRWPPGVAGVAGRRVAGLLEGAVFVPHDPELAVGGITAQVTPAQARDAVTPLLRSWGLLPVPDGKDKRLNSRKGTR